MHYYISSSHFELWSNFRVATLFFPVAKQWKINQNLFKFMSYKHNIATQYIFMYPPTAILIDFLICKHTQHPRKNVIISYKLNHNIALSNEALKRTLPGMKAPTYTGDFYNKFFTKKAIRAIRLESPFTEVVVLNKYSLL